MPVVSAYSDGVAVISYCLLDKDGAVLAERGADTKFYAASTIKLAVLVAALRMVDGGLLSLEQTLASRHSFPSRIPAAGEFSFVPDEIDAGMPPVGEPMPLRDVLRRMITVSSNEATNMTVALTGFDAVNEALRICGAASSKMERIIGDVAALEAGFTHEITARDLAAVLRAIVGGQAAGPDSTQLMIDFLRAQEFGIIGLAVPAADWGSKSGWVTGIRHDAAFLVPGGGTRADSCILAVCTRAYEEDAAEEAIQAVSAMAWRLYTERHGHTDGRGRL